MGLIEKFPSFWHFSGKSFYSRKQRQEIAMAKAPPPPEVVNAIALGECIGVSEQQVIRLTRMGILRRIGHGRYPFKENVQAYIAHLKSEAEAAAGTNPDNLSWRREVMLLTRSKREAQEMRNTELRRELVPREVAIASFQTVLVQVREMVRRIPGRVAARARSMTPHDISVIDDELTRALASLAEEPSK